MTNQHSSRELPSQAAIAEKLDVSISSIKRARTIKATGATSVSSTNPHPRQRSRCSTWRDEHVENYATGASLLGARAIAEVLFGPEDAKSQWHKVYSLKHELPIFSMGSNLVAYENQLREVMAGKAAKALERMTEARAT